MKKNNFIKRCYLFSIRIIKITKSLSGQYYIRPINNQVLRSATSICANILEARSASSRIEYKRYFEIALRSADETIYWIFLLKDCDCLEKEIAISLIKESREIAKILTCSIKTLKKVKR